MFLAQDARNKEITSQVESIQQELASLSMVEMTKTNLKVNIEWLNEFYVFKLLFTILSSLRMIVRFKMYP